MLSLILLILSRIFSNSYLNLFQKLLTIKGEHSSIVNFYTYLGLTIIAFLICPTPIINLENIYSILAMGCLGALGNFFIIKALSCGELSVLAPINSYKPIVALIISFFLLGEIPTLISLLGIGLIVTGTIVLGGKTVIFNKAAYYRFLALFLLGTEAVFIKKVILLTDVKSAFLYWVLVGLFFATIFALFSNNSFKIQKNNVKYQVALILFVSIMQYTTNCIFSRMNVAYALALFQLSTILSVLLGANIFKEGQLLKKITASFIMIIGAVLIILKF